MKNHQLQINAANTIHTLKSYCHLANTILYDRTEYIKTKEIISQIFKLEQKNRYETIFLRLSVIDGFYSTQMNKRLFGLYDIAMAINDKFKTDEALIYNAKLFLEDPDKKSNLRRLFEKEYGIKKNGNEFGQAVSLISKYLYFLTGYQFPIYDSLAKKSYRVLMKNYPELNLNKINGKFDFSFFKNINTLNGLLEINDYNKLDNFLWFLGKISYGSLSSIIARDTYVSLINKTTKHISNQTDVVLVHTEDDKMRLYLKDNEKKLNRLFPKNENLSKFIAYSFTLLDNK